MLRSHFFASITFGDGFCQFQDNKVSLIQASGHNHENTLLQLAGTVLFKSANTTVVAITDSGLHFICSKQHRFLVKRLSFGALKLSGEKTKGLFK